MRMLKTCSMFGRAAGEGSQHCVTTSATVLGQSAGTLHIIRAQMVVIILSWPQIMIPSRSQNPLPKSTQGKARFDHGNSRVVCVCKIQTTNWQVVTQASLQWRYEDDWAQDAIQRIDRRSPSAGHETDAPMPCSQYVPLILACYKRRPARSPED